MSSASGWEWGDHFISPFRECNHKGSNFEQVISKSTSHVSQEVSGPIYNKDSQLLIFSSQSFPRRLPKSGPLNHLRLWNTFHFTYTFTLIFYLSLLTNFISRYGMLSPRSTWGNWFRQLTCHIIQIKYHTLKFFLWVHLMLISLMMEVRPVSLDKSWF